MGAQLHGARQEGAGAGALHQVQHLRYVGRAEPHGFRVGLRDHRLVDELDPGDPLEDLPPLRRLLPQRVQADGAARTGERREIGPVPRVRRVGAGGPGGDVDGVAQDPAPALGEVGVRAGEQGEGGGVERVRVPGHRTGLPDPAPAARAAADGCRMACPWCRSRVLTRSPRRSDRAVHRHPVPCPGTPLRTRTNGACSPSFRSIARFLAAGTPVPRRRAPATRRKPMRAGRIPCRGTVHAAATERSAGGSEGLRVARRERFRSTVRTGVRPPRGPAISTHASANTARSGPNCPSAVALWWRPPHRAPRTGGAVLCAPCGSVRPMTGFQGSRQAFPGRFSPAG